MFKPHILTKLIKRSNLYEIRNLLLVGGDGEILNSAYLFPKIELENDGNGLKYRVLGEKVRLKDYHQLLERELATEVHKINLNPEDILEFGVVEETKVIELFTDVNKKAKYFKIKLKKDIVLFLILLIEHLRAKEKFRMRTAYAGSEIYFEFLASENIKRKDFWIYWRNVMVEYGGCYRFELVINLLKPAIRSYLGPDRGYDRLIK